MAQWLWAVTRTQVQTSPAQPAPHRGPRNCSAAQGPRLWSGDDSILTTLQAGARRWGRQAAALTPTKGSGHHGYSTSPETVAQNTQSTPPSAYFVLFAKVFFKLFILCNLADVTKKTVVTWQNLHSQIRSSSPSWWLSSLTSRWQGEKRGYNYGKSKDRLSFLSANSRAVCSPLGQHWLSNTNENVSDKTFLPVMKA